MKNVAVVGSQWGDEGKGKIVDWLSEQADVVIRFQGGHNAGHTLVIDKKVFKLRLLPSGIVRDGKISILGNGVVIDPWALLDEIEDIKKQGIEVNPENFQTNKKGIFAAGDICSYPGKLKLILSGFHEVALASVECFKRARPNEKYKFQFTTSSKEIQDRLGIKK